MTKVKLQKWGNSQGIRIPKDVLKKLDLENAEDLEFELTIQDNTISLTPIVELTPYERLFVGYDLNKKRAQFNWDDQESN